MKKELSTVELYYLVQELQSVVDARVDQIFQPSTREVLLSFHKSGTGKVMIRILPTFIFLTQVKGKNPQNPPKFCTLLRKHLGSARIRSIKQLGSERILECKFTTKDSEYYLYIELFAKGNVILTGKDKKIIGPLDNQIWKDRIVKRGEIYKYPQKPFNAFDYKKEDLQATIKNTKKENVVKTVAVDIGVGGTYAEEILASLKIDKNNEKFKPKEIELLHKELQKLLKKKPKGYIYRKEAVKDITPVKIAKYTDLKAEEKPTYSQALDEVLSTHIEEQKQEAFKSKYDKDIRKVQLIIDTQKQQIENLQKQVQDNQTKGERIYEEYQIIKSILDELKKAQKKHSLQDIKKKLKDHKIIKDINPKEKTISVEL